jgi:GTP-binding protein EngB required for normal cell division
MTIHTFAKRKAAAVKKLQQLRAKLTDFEHQFQMEFSDVRQILDGAEADIEKAPFQIAVFGAFSDGKSTVLSTLTGQTVKIAPGPTTSSVETYALGEYFIVDTPGLFSGTAEHDAKARDCISRAHVLMFIADALNPIKDSQLDTIRWLLHDLDKLDTSIFVVNKMDEQADLDDQQDFDRAAAIKVKVVHNTLQTDAGVSEPDSVPVVCIAADPYAMGLESWLDKREEYRQLSRIGELESALETFMVKVGDGLLEKGLGSVVRDAVQRSRGQLRGVTDDLKNQQKIVGQQVAELRTQTQGFERELRDSHLAIRDQIIAYREDLLLAIAAVDSVDQLRDIVRVKIGSDDGHILQIQVDDIIRKNTVPIQDQQHTLLRQVEQSLQFHEELQARLAKQLADVGFGIGQALLSVSTRALADGILKTRNALKIPLKFKPWGAVKAAKWVHRIGRFLKALAVIMAVLDGLLEVWSDCKFKKARDQLKDELEAVFQAFLESFTAEEYEESYFPHVGTVRDAYSQLSNADEHLSEVLVQVETAISELGSLV